MKKLTVIIPCFNEEEALPIYYREMSKVMEEMPEVDTELLFIDDGSTDRTLGVMKDLHILDARCKYLSFSRNFGKEAAIYAGLKNAAGDYVAVMDVDLQDPPDMLPKMYKILEEEGYDSVATKRSTRTGEPRIRSFLSRSFYKFINKISKTEIVNGARDYRLMKRNMVDAVLNMSEYNRFSKGIFEWVGFRTKWLEFENVERSAGKTKLVIKKIIFLFHGRNYRVFSSAIVSGIHYGGTVLFLIFYYYWVYCDADFNLGRPGIRLAFSGLHPVFCGRNSTSLYRNCGTVFIKNLFGNKAQTNLYFKRKQRRRT